MVKVIAVQEAQLKMLRDTYDKNISTVAPVNDINKVLEQSNPVMVSNNPIPVVPQIDMESQVVNLNSQATPFDSNITNVDVTKEVFGTNTNNANVEPSIFPANNNPVNVVNDTSNFNVPYQEPQEVSNNSSDNIVNEDATYELLNSIRNLITDFANNAYAAIDKFQEERLQINQTGASLLENNSSVISNDPVPYNNRNENVGFAQIPEVPNMFDTQNSDLDKTVVLPADFIANNITEPENQMKISA